jgi:energy-coupling factor transporter ATP-binding protein EcfA2
LSPGHPIYRTIRTQPRLFDEATGLVDRQSLEAAISLGICEAVDFITPVDDSHFLLGIDVVPGHIVAGLTFDRPKLVEDILAGLDRRRVTLVVGPSGSGKSAAVWMAAYASRHFIKWYRIKRLGRDDVEPILRLAQSMRPSESMPIGFVADNLGRIDREGWDHFVDEALQRPGIVLLGASREEDIFLIRSAFRSHQLHPRLENVLAERMWKELRDSGLTPWLDWREPFEFSRGLLLEYGYLLTTGIRLVPPRGSHWAV